MIKKNLLIATLLVFGVLACSDKEPKSQDSDAGKTQTIGSVERLDPAVDKIVPANAVLEILTSGHDWTEGPVWVPALKSVLYSDIPKNSIFQWSEGKEAAVWLTPSGYTGETPRGGESGCNGLLLDLEGRLLLAQHGDRRIARLDAPWEKPESKFTTVAGKFKGKRFNSPNDLAVKSNGDIYFTDPPYGLEEGMEDPTKELDMQGVYRVDTKGNVTLLTDEISRPNGIAFSPDESILYVANSDGNQPVMRAFDVLEDGTLANGRVFFNTWGDGMAVDQDGNIYATGPGGVLIISPDGKHLGNLLTTQRTSNCTFGENGSTLFITADMHLLRIRLNSKGVGF